MSIKFLFMVTFFLYLSYEGEEIPRLVAEGCNKEQLLEVLSRHLMLAEVDNFKIIPVEYECPFHEFTL